MSYLSKNPATSAFHTQCSTTAASARSATKSTGDRLISVSQEKLENNSRMVIEGKKCTKCDEVKPLGDFYAQKLGRFGRQANCKACHAVAQARWLKANGARFKSYQRSWVEKNATHLKEYWSSWHLANKERRNTDARARYYENHDAYSTRNKQWSKDNKDKVRQYAVASEQKRRAAKMNSSGSFTEEDVRRLYALQRGKCAVCAEALTRSFHRDHVTPLSGGGSNDKYNLQLLCKSCNSRKHRKDPITFMQSRGYLL